MVLGTHRRPVPNPTQDPGPSDPRPRRTVPPWCKRGKRPDRSWEGVIPGRDAGGRGVAGKWSWRRVEKKTHVSSDGGDREIERPQDAPTNENEPESEWGPGTVQARGRQRFGGRTRV